jgi:hypothetical protein
MLSSSKVKDVILYGPSLRHMGFRFAEFPLLSRGTFGMTPMAATFMAYTDGLCSISQITSTSTNCLDEHVFLNTFH